MRAMWVAFAVDDRQFGVELAAVDRVVRMVEVTVLPGAPDYVMGAINLHGQIVAALDVRRRFGLERTRPTPQGQLIVAHTARRVVALVVDHVRGVIERPLEDVTPAERIAPGMECVQGVTRLDDGLLLIHDLDRFLSLDDERLLDGLLAENKRPPQ